MGDSDAVVAAPDGAVETKPTDDKKAGDEVVERPKSDAWPTARALGIAVPEPEDSVWYDADGMITMQCLKDHHPVEAHAVAAEVEEGDTKVAAVGLAQTARDTDEKMRNLQDRFERVQHVDITSKDLARSKKPVSATWQADVLLKGEEELAVFDTVGFTGMPSIEPGCELKGAGRVMLTKLGDRHRIHFMNRSETAQIRAHEEWKNVETESLSKDGLRDSVSDCQASGVYGVERSAHITTCNINVEGNVFHVDCQIDRDATLALMMGGRQHTESHSEDKPCCDCSCFAECCTDCSCKKCCTCPCWFPCLLCRPCIECWQNCCACECMAPCCRSCCGCCTPCHGCCPCCRPISYSVASVKAGIWDFMPPAFTGISQEVSIHEEIKNVDLEFPDGCKFSGEQKEAGKVKAVHCVHIFYRNPTTDSVALCTAKISPEAELPKINHFVSELGFLCEAPDKTLSDRKQVSLESVYSDVWNNKGSSLVAPGRMW
jgi:hypothetical protein